MLRNSKMKTFAIPSLYMTSFLSIALLATACDKDDDNDQDDADESSSASSEEGSNADSEASNADDEGSNEDASGKGEGEDSDAQDSDADSANDDDGNEKSEDEGNDDSADTEAMDEGANEEGAEENSEESSGADDGGTDEAGEDETGAETSGDESADEAGDEGGEQPNCDFNLEVGSGTKPTYTWDGGGAHSVSVMRTSDPDSPIWGIVSPAKMNIASPLTHGSVPADSFETFMAEKELTAGVEYRVSVAISEESLCYTEFTP